MFSWNSKKQDIVARSTTETEYVAATVAVNQAIWLRRILADLHMEQKEPTQILLIIKQLFPFQIILFFMTGLSISRSSFF